MSKDDIIIVSIILATVVLFFLFFEQREWEEDDGLVEIYGEPLIKSFMVTSQFYITYLIADFERWYVKTVIQISFLILIIQILKNIVKGEKAGIKEEIKKFLITFTLVTLTTNCAIILFMS